MLFHARDIIFFLFNIVKHHVLRIWALWKETIFTIINLNQYENKHSIVIHNRQKMWRENVAFDNKFITKKNLKFT